MMKNLAWLPLVSVMLLSACATQTKTAKNTDKNTWRSFGEEETTTASSRVQRHLVDEMTNCEGCILGSSHHGTFTSPLRVYELKDVNHLNLKNTHFDFPVVWNSQVQKWVQYFTGKGREWFVRYSERAGRYAPVLSKILADNGLPRDLIYLAMAESGFQNQAKSWARAVGPWQFMSFTGKRYGLNIDWYVDERRDPLKASLAAAGYLKDLYDLFGSWELAAAGYNAGEGKIGRAIQRYGTRDFWKLSKGRYLRPETKNYVPKIMALAIIGKNLESFGFHEIAFDHALDYDEIKVNGSADLYSIAQALELDFDEIRRYNPELLRWTTPPDEEGYALRVPVGKGAVWNSFGSKDQTQAVQYMTYHVQREANLSHIAKKYRVPVDVLTSLNPEYDGQRLSKNTEVKLPFRVDHGTRHPLYADLYERAPRHERARRSYYRFMSSVAKRGKRISNPTEFYVVKKGDTLWQISKKTGVSLGTIIRSNSQLQRRRHVMPGDRLAIR